MSGRRILLTGCSGAGKSTLLEEMARRDWEVMKEPGRRVIRMESRMGGTGLPWEDATRFAQLCLKMAKADWESVRIGTVIFDRGVWDAGFHLDRLGRAEEGLMARYPYDDPVILAPPWEDLFATDPDRRHSFADAVAEYEDIAARLDRAKVPVAVLPQADVGARADWLVETLTSR